MMNVLQQARILSRIESNDFTSLQMYTYLDILVKDERRKEVKEIKRESRILQEEKAQTVYENGLED